MSPHVATRCARRQRLRMSADYLPGIAALNSVFAVSALASRTAIRRRCLRRPAICQCAGTELSDERNSLCRDHADQRFARRPQGARCREARRILPRRRRIARSCRAATARSRSAPADRPLLAIEARPSAKPDDPRSAGLFHTAFLLPSRADLGRWIKHADRQADPDRRRVRPPGQRGALPHRPRRQRHRDLRRPRRARNGRSERRTSRWRPSGSTLPDVVARGAGGRCRLEGRAGEQRHRPCPSARRRPGRGRDAGGTRNSASTRWRNTAPRPCSCRPAAITTTSAPTPGRAPGPGRRDPVRSGLSWVEFAARDGTERRLQDPWGTEIVVRPS